MDTEQIRDFCVNTLNGQRFDGLVAYWEYPGFVMCSAEDGWLDENRLTVEVIATPDFVNGEPTRLVLQVHYDGLVLELGDETDVDWGAPNALETWREAVRARLPWIRLAFDAVRRRGEEGLRDLMALREAA